VPKDNNEQRRTNNDERSHDRCPEKSVIFGPPICHGLNGMNKLSHTHTLPPNPARAPPASRAAGYFSGFTVTNSFPCVS
jgi:hypothetical protein